MSRTHPKHAPSPRRLRVVSVAHGGEGMAHVEDAPGEPGGQDEAQHQEKRLAVFVTGALPGELVEAEVDFGRRPARAATFSLLESSPDRVAPPCPIATTCGGCDLMHASVAAQGEVHAALVRDALRRVGAELPAVVVHPAPASERYRTRARLAVQASARRGVHVGYREASGHGIVQPRSCLVLDAVLEPVLSHLRQDLAGEVGAGEAMISRGHEGRPAVVLSWQGELRGQVFGRLEARVKKADWAGVEVRLAGAREPARIGDPRTVTIAGDGGPLVVPAGGFAQANPAVSRALSDRAASLLAPTLEDEVLELFAGSGNLTVALVPLARSVSAVESDPRAAGALRANLATRGLTARVVCTDADAFEPPPRARLVLLDPPREGAAGAVSLIARSRVARVVYVSCDAATLARDAETLVKAGFSLDTVETFEMFPHTSHVEIIARFARDKARPRPPS